MLKTATRRKNLALLGVAAVFVVIFILLGNWQLGRAGINQPAAPTRVLSLTEVLTPHQKLSGDVGTHPIAVTGRYADLPQVRVVDQVAGKDWVVAALTVTGADGQDATLPIARGMIPAGSELPAAPSGQVTLVGRMQASHAPNRITTSDALDGVSLADLRNRWPGKMYAGYLAVRTAAVADGKADHPATHEPGQVAGVAVDSALADPVPLAEAPRVMAWHNVSYSLQWYCFAVFAVYMWLRVVWTEHRRDAVKRREEALAALNTSSNGQDPMAGAPAP